MRELAVRLPRVRIRTMMLAVAVGAVVFAAIRQGPEGVHGLLVVLGLFLTILLARLRAGNTGGIPAIRRVAEDLLLVLGVLALLAVLLRGPR
jgi:hypothetical protein